LRSVIRELHDSAGQVVGSSQKVAVHYLGSADDLQSHPAINNRRIPYDDHERPCDARSIIRSRDRDIRRQGLIYTVGDGIRSRRRGVRVHLNSQRCPRRIHHLERQGSRIQTIMKHAISGQRHAHQHRTHPSSIHIRALGVDVVVADIVERGIGDL